MFVYCNNNPVNLADSSGKYPVDCTIEPNAQIGWNFAQWYIQTDENETDQSGELTLNAKTKKTLQAATNNCVVSAGVGLGLYGGLTATEYMSLDAGIYYDVFRIDFYGGKIETYEYAYEGLEAGLFFWKLGSGKEQRREIINRPNTWQEMESPTVIPVFGVGGYFLGGGSITIGFDLNSFLTDFDDIWGN